MRIVEDNNTIVTPLLICNRIVSLCSRDHTIAYGFGAPSEKNVSPH
jgi:hypothetical protein